MPIPNLKPAVWFLGLFLISVGASAEPVVDRLEELAGTKQWHRLLHYNRSFPFTGFKSRLDGPDFFLAPDGRRNPASELRASVQAFSQDIKIGRLKQHPQCAFPERYRWLKAELGLSIVDVPCPLYQEFQDKFNARSATFVFSSAYPSNPSSMFGHSFLRINSNAPSGTDQKKLDILDFGINYAAVVNPGENGVAYAWLGLMGGYPGAFSMMPYYFKIAEYSNSESRDIWEYDLSLTAEQTRRLIAHTWELETTSYFDYYFFDENCAYQTLALLEAVRPDWDLTDFTFYVVPGEAIKRLTAEPGAVTSVRFRPSLRKKMLAKYTRLSSDQKSQFHGLTESRLDPKAVSEATTLEAGASYLHYEKERSGGKLKEADENRLRALLIRRSELGLASGPDVSEAYAEESRPEGSHSPYRFGVSGGVESAAAIGGTGYFQQLEFKLAFHDLLNNDKGYLRFSQVDFLDLAFRYHAARRVFSIEKIEALAMTSLFPMSFLEHRPSWRIELAYVSPKDLGCEFCNVFHVEGGIGAAIQAGADTVISAMLLGQLEAGAAFARNFRWGPKAELAALSNPTANYKIRGATTMVLDAGQVDRQGYFAVFKLEQSYSIKTDFELRNTLERVMSPSNSDRTYTEASLSFNLYY